jgi:large subunit ribosomal protein L5
MVKKNKDVSAKAPAVAGKSRLAELYATKLRQDLKKQLAFTNIMEVPCLQKIVINIGVKEAVSDSKALQVASDVLTAISGQMPVKTVARQSIAGFKIRSGMKIGTCVTLRKEKMYAFLDRLINTALPKVRDFQGIPNRLDGRGNYNLGISEWIIFPEAEAIAGDKVYGLNISIQTTAKNDEHAHALLKSFGMPFKK